MNCGLHKVLIILFLFQLSGDLTRVKPTARLAAHAVITHQKTQLMDGGKTERNI